MGHMMRMFRRATWRFSALKAFVASTSRTPLLDSADTRTRFRGYPRRCRGKTADFRRGQSADFVKFLVTSTVRMCKTPEVAKVWSYFSASTISLSCEYPIDGGGHSSN